jgi:hypothetical protein
MTVNTAIHAKELVIAKSEGLGPHAVMTMLSVIKGNQFFRIQTARQAFRLLHHPQGLLARRAAETRQARTRDSAKE